MGLRQDLKSKNTMCMYIGAGIVLEFPLSPLSKANRQRRGLTELKKLEFGVRANDLVATHYALEVCKVFALPLPIWLHKAMSGIIQLVQLRDRRALTKNLQREVDKIRWATVKHLRHEKQLSWPDAYAAASSELTGRFGGSEETMKLSYRKYQSSDVVRTVLQKDQSEHLRFARYCYEAFRSGGASTGLEKVRQRIYGADKRSKSSDTTLIGTAKNLSGLGGRSATPG